MHIKILPVVDYTANHNYYIVDFDNYFARIAGRCNYSFADIPDTVDDNCAECRIPLPMGQEPSPAGYVLDRNLLDNSYFGNLEQNQIISR